MIHSNNRYSGFTLIEVMITIAVFAILTAIAAPSFSNVIKQSNISASANTIYTEFLFLRGEALKQHREIYLCHTTNGSQCSGSSITGDANWDSGYLAFSRSKTSNANTWPDTDNGDTLLLVNQAFGDTSLSSNLGKLIRIQANGTTDNFNFVVCSFDNDESLGKTIAISASGRPHIQHSVDSDCEVQV